jgi:hypothetical protein
MKKKILTFWMVITLLSSVNAQKNFILVGSDIPLQYAVGYEYCPIRWVGFQGKAGLLSTPYDKAILGIMEVLGTNPSIVNMIDGAFEVGGIGQANINFHAKRWYYGIQGQFIALSAADIPSNLVANYYNYNFTPVTTITNPFAPQVDIMMRSNLLQAGVCIGRKVDLLKWAEVRFEFSIGKNIWSGTNVDVTNIKGTVFGLQYSEQYLSNEISAELQAIYKRYAYTPSLNIYWVFKY